MFSAIRSLSKRISRRLATVFVAMLLVAVAAAFVGKLPFFGISHPSSEFAIEASYAGRYGTTTLEERIVNSDIIVRAEFVSAKAGSRFTRDGHASVMRYRFRVLEYLAGSGGKEVDAVIEACCPGYESSKDAKEYARHWFAVNSVWNDRHMILFLNNPAPSFSWLGLRVVYEFAGPGEINHRRYLIDSEENKAWLPAATAPSQVSSAASGDDQLFLTDSPPVSSIGSDVSSANLKSTITLGALKKRIAAVESEIAQYDTASIGRECVQSKYGVARYKKWNVDTRSVSTDDFEMQSGQPAGTEFDRAGFGGGGVLQN